MMTDRVPTASLAPAIRDFLRGVYERANARIAAAIAAHGRRPGLSAAIARERIAVLDGELAPVVAAMRQAGTAVACAKGCGCCCTLTIDVTPDEVFALKDHLESTLDARQLAAVKDRAAMADAQGHGLPPIERHRKRIACPVQDPLTQACLGHAARPNACQGYLSLDVGQCWSDHRDPPQRVPKPTAAVLLTDLIDNTRSYALEDLGVPRLSLELTAALVAAWREPDAEKRWLAGEAIFADCRSYGPPADSQGGGSAQP